MAETVETAVYRLRVEGQAEIDRLTKSVDGLAVAEEKATASNRTFSQSLQNNVARIDPLVRAQEQYRKALETNLRYRETGVGTEAQLNAQLEASTKRYQEQVAVINQVEKATVSHTNAQKLQGYQMLNLSRQIQDVGVSLVGGMSPLTVMAQQLPQIFDISQQSGVSLTNMFKQVGAAALGFAMSIPGIITGLVAAGAAMGYLAIKASDASKQTELALSGPGAASGMQPADITNFAQQNATITALSRSQAKELGEEWAHTGKIAVNELTGVGEAVVGLSVKTKTSFAEAGTALGKLFAADDLTKAVDQLSGEYPELNANIRASVDALQQQGERAKATQLIMDTMAESNRKAADNMSGFAKASNALGNVLQLRPFEEPAKRLEDQLTDIENKVAKIEARPVTGGSALAIQDLTEKWEKLNQELTKTQELAAQTKLDMIGNEAQKMARDLDPTIQKLTEVRLAIQRVQEAQFSGAPGANTPEVTDLLIKLQNQEKLLTDAQNKTRALNQLTAELRERWGDVSLETARALEAMNNQLPVIEAVGGAAKMAAQAAADYANAIAKAVPPAEAAALAAAKLAAAQAEANTKSKESVWQTQNQMKASEQYTGLIADQKHSEAELNQMASELTPLKKMAAEEQAKLNQLIRDGVDPEQAAAQIAAEHANSIQQANQKALERLQTLQLELQMAQAVTGQQQQMVQYQQTLDDLLGQGVEKTLAMAVAQKEYEVSVAKASSAVFRQVEALKDSTAMIQARGTGAEAETAAAIAYKNAIQSGASATAAAALSAATLENELAKAAASATTIKRGMGGWTASFEGGAFDVPGSGPGKGKTGVSVTTLDPVTMSLFQNPMQAPSYADLVNQAMLGGTGSALAFAMGQQAHGQIAQTVPGFGGTPMEITGGVAAQAVTESDIISQVQSLYQLQQSQTADKAAQAQSMQTELAWLQSRPQSLEQQRAIVSLKQSIEDLIKSTDSLNATNQELLSPYYTQDPRTSHIGFRSQGMALGGYVDVPGGYSTNDNMIATIPVSSGERIYIDPNNSMRGTGGGGSMTINISSPVVIQGNANQDVVGRTMFQNNQTLAKQIRSATK